MTSGPWVQLQCPRAHRLVSICYLVNGRSVGILWNDGHPPRDDNWGALDDAWPVAQTAVAGVVHSPQTIEDFLAGPDEQERIRFDCQECTYDGRITKNRLLGVARRDT